MTSREKEKMKLFLLSLALLSLAMAANEATYEAVYRDSRFTNFTHPQFLERRERIDAMLKMHQTRSENDCNVPDGDYVFDLEYEEYSYGHNAIAGGVFFSDCSIRAGLVTGRRCISGTAGGKMLAEGIVYFDGGIFNIELIGTAGEYKLAASVCTDADGCFDGYLIRTQQSESGGDAYQGALDLCPTSG